MQSNGKRQRRNTMSSTDNASNIIAMDSKKSNAKQELVAANIKLLIEQLEVTKISMIWPV
jgi:hypothetical protein